MRPLGGGPDAGQPGIPGNWVQPDQAQQLQYWQALAGMQAGARMPSAQPTFIASVLPGEHAAVANSAVHVQLSQAWPAVQQA